MSEQDKHNQQQVVNQSSTKNGKRKALIIAVSDYDNLPKARQLPFCKNDGEALYKILQEQGYEISDDWKLIGRVTSNQLKRAIFDFFRKQAKSRDTLLFYFSGHGVPDGHGGHYLAPSDIETDLPDYCGFRFNELEDQANKSLAKKIIRILDCCFSGAAEVKGNEDDVAKSARSAMERTFKEGDGKCVLASSLADQVSYKMKGEPYSLFTYCLLEGLKGGNGEAVNLEGYVTPYTLGRYVYDRITSTDKRQKPITKTETSGDIILAYYPKLIERQEKEIVRASAPLTSSSFSKSNEQLLPLLEAAHTYYVRRDYKRADIFFEMVLQIDPNHIEALNNRGISLYRLGEYNEAKNCFNKVLEIDPENIVALNTIEILDKKKDGSSQYVEKPAQIHENDYQKAMKRFSIDMWLHKGNTNYSFGKYEEAISCYDKVLEVKPNDASAWYLRACSRVKKGDIEDGLYDLIKAIVIDKRYIELAKQEKVFDSLRNDERFKALVSK